MGPKASATRHADIARDLRDAILAGSMPVGSVLPKELELASRYGVSRHTVRVAIAHLTEEGLVNPRKRFGTVVQAARPARSYRQTVASVEDLVQYSADHVRSVHTAEHIKADNTLARDLGCPVGTRWFCISSLRYDRGIGDEPLGLTNVYVKPDEADVVDLARQSPDRLISSLIADRTGQRIARIDQDVTAMVIDRELAALLVVGENSAALRIVRHYLDDDGQLFVASVSIHPASRFHLSSRLERIGSE